MSRTSKEEAPLLVDTEILTGRYAELDEHTVSFESFHVDADGAPMFRGLPDDRCQCPHWGLVVAGPYALRYEEGEERYGTGDVFHARPGHVPVVSAGTEIMHFSPTDAFRDTMAVVAANMQAAPR